ncbi:hypothetical protein B9T31_04180 [Acinetobacter sp. ANC 4558]|uniref:phage tail tape measure protein n=1 Tax=Acinetobacter sp. ANC 4558 TaxID=1977876 RepID=UPI000A33F01A|nr:phage tail tape measure protein [Acinetobacter sp. ANC 4558]OTG87702.1 hypothetical protein B9T31_04180 [Acinetobacter sp. ANC 4558]
MSTKNTTVSLTLQIKGTAGQELKRISDDQVRSTLKLNQQWTQVQSTQTKFTQTAKAGHQAVLSTARVGDQLLRTNRMLDGVLRQQSSQTKLQSQQLKNQATSAKNIADSMRKVEQSSRKTTQESGLTVSNWQKVAALGGAAIAGGAVVSSALQKPRDYQQLMTYITSTATGGQGLSTAQRQDQGNLLHQYVKDAVRNGGGTREDAAAALNELIASGKYDVSDVAPALNASTRTAFAAGADSVDAAKMTLAMQNFDVKDLSLAQDRALRAGQVGSFEYKDMAKFLPEQMAMARASGYSGDDGLVKLLALNQIAKTTASDSATAGNNVVNLLQKLSSREFSDSMAKSVENTQGLPTKGIKNKKGKIVGQEFDWSTYSIQQREKGVYGVEAFVQILERQLAGNAQYTNLQKQVQNAKTNEERKSLLSDMSNIAMGSEMGQIIADRQALMAAMAAVYNKNETKVLEGKISNAKGTVSNELDYVKTQEWVKDQAMNQEKLFSQSKAYDAVSESLGNVKDSITEWAQQNEALAASAYGASVALAAVATAGAVGTLLGGKGGTIKNKVGGGLATATNAAAPIAKTVGVAAAAYTGYELFKPVDDYLYGKISKLFGGFGDRPDFLQQAIDKNIEQQNQKNNELIAKQEQSNQYSRELISNIKTLIGVTQNNKPIINFPMPTIQQSILGTPAQEENRHGAIPPFLQRK